MDSIVLPRPKANAEPKGDHSRHETRMVHARLGVITGLFMALRAKHSPAASHSLRVAFWASAWGVHHGVSDEQLQMFEMVGLLHEIGKIGIPDRVLQKPTALNDNEQAMMELHPEVGVEILRASGASEELLLAIQCIGTRYDEVHNGQGQSAPLASHLINILDAFDSMTTSHPYRNAISREQALAELLRLGGTQFDPNLTHVFADIVLHPRPEIEARVRERWLNMLEISNRDRFFQLDATNTSLRSASTRGALNNYVSDAFYRHMIDHIPDGVIFVDSEFLVLDWNVAAERLTGKSADSVLHQRWSPRFASLCDIHGGAISDRECPISALILHGKKDRQRYFICRENHPLTSVSAEVIPVRDDHGNICGATMILKDLSEQAVLEEKIVHLREQASVDQLTKVANRGELNRQLPEFVKYHHQHNVPGSVIICDIDFFKKINDRFSHQAGDEALKVFASILKESSRETDFVARYGGEEFVLLCTQCELAAAKKLAESIRRRLQRTPIAELRNACITASFGVTSIQPGDTDEIALGRADRGLLIAKESGRDRVIAIGLEQSVPADQPAPKESSRWMQWLGLSAGPPTLNSELVCNVPLDVSLQKFKGFVQEMKANVVHVSDGRAILEIDYRQTPIPRTPEERLGKFQVNITISEFEMKVGKKGNGVQACTVFRVEINPMRHRDRRRQSAINQSLKLKQAFQCCMIAHEMDEETRMQLQQTHPISPSPAR